MIYLDLMGEDLAAAQKELDTPKSQARTMGIILLRTNSVKRATAVVGDDIFGSSTFLSRYD